MDYGYVLMIEQRYGTRHGYIPPGMKNANADVESAQSTSQKDTKTPWEIIRKDRPDIAPEVLLFPVVDVDALFRIKFSMPSRGQFIPAFAV